MLQEDTNKEVQKNNSVSKLGLPLNSAYTKEESRDEQEIDIPLTALNKVRIRLRVKPSPPHAESKTEFLSISLVVGGFVKATYLCIFRRRGSNTQERNTKHWCRSQKSMEVGRPRPSGFSKLSSREFWQRHFALRRVPTLMKHRGGKDRPSPNPALLNAELAALFILLFKLLPRHFA